MGKERRQHRQIKSAIRGAIKSLKRGEIPYPPEPTRMSAEDSRRFIEELQERLRKLRAETTRLESDGSRRGHKQRLRVDSEIQRLDQFLKDSATSVV